MSNLSQPTPSPHRILVLDQGSPVGALMRMRDWTKSELGDPSGWPQSLTSIVGLMLNSKFPMFVAWGPELTFLYNDAYSEILGEKHPAALGAQFRVIWAEIWQEIGPLVDAALQGEATFQDRRPLTLRRRGYDEQTWFTFSYSPVLNEEGRVAGMFCVCTETTAQVLEARERAEEIGRLSDLFEQAPGFMAVLTGPDHVFELTNKAYLQLIGYRNVIGKPVRDALPEVEGQGFFELLDQVYATGEAFIGHSLRAEVQRTKDAAREEVFMDLIYQPIRGPSGEVSGVFVEGSDVTERQRAQRLLHDSDRRKDEFLAMLAHELRNPLAPIRSAAHLLTDPRLGREGLTQASAVIGRQVQHMTSLVDDLLDLSRISRGLVTLAKRTVAIRAVIDDACEQTRVLMDQRGHTLSVSLPDEILLVQGDRTRLVQIVSNVLHNAAKYTAEGGRIEVSAQGDASSVKIRISDNGSGIDADLMPVLFDFFTQAERTLGRAEGGLGVGLALVKRLVELHGGSVSAHSDGRDRGAEFVITLERTIESDESAKSSSPQLDSPGRRDRPLRVMVVDDNVDAAQMLATLLELHGYEVLVEYEGRAGLARAMTALPDAMIVDIGLPDIDGYELARAVKAVPALSDSMLIALTGYGQPSDIARSAGVGFHHHFVKPANIENLIAVLQGI